MVTPIIDAAKVLAVAQAVIETVCELDSEGEPLQTSTPAQGGYLQGWWIALCRQATAVLTLSEADLAYESAPLLRGMVEHSVLIELVAQDPTAWRITERARSGVVAKYEQWLLDHGYGTWPDLQAIRAGLAQASPADRPALDYLAAFRAQCDHLGAPTGHRAYARYQYLTHHSHAGMESATTFLTLSGCNCDVCHGQLPLARPLPESLAGAVLLECASVYNRLLPSHPWTEVINNMEVEYRPIRMSMGGPPLHVDLPAPT